MTGALVLAFPPKTARKAPWGLTPPTLANGPRPFPTPRGRPWARVWPWTSPQQTTVALGSTAPPTCGAGG